MLKMGTFHSICIKLLRRHSSAAGIDKKFSVANNRDVNDILESVLDDLETELEAVDPKDERLRDEKDKFDKKQVKKHISYLKSKAIDVESYKDQDHRKDLLLIYKEFDKRMKQQSMLDFDDILLLCLRLLRQEICLHGIKHVLIDEFQDTNTIQMELVKEFARQNQYAPDNITVVGDVDQSIYAFRGAMAENFSLFKTMYPQLSKVDLKENYRSTQDILDASELIMKDQPNRHAKVLAAQASESFNVTYKKFSTDQIEAQFIAKEVKHILSLNVFNKDDICILVRSNYVTRIIERELRTINVQYSILKGRAFWDRKEVSAMIDLLRITVRPLDRCALLRVLGSNEGLGDISIKKIGSVMENKAGSLSPSQVLTSIADRELKVERLTAKGLDVCGSVLKKLKEARRLYYPGTDERDSALNLFDLLLLDRNIQSLISNDEEKHENVLEIRRHLEVFTPEENTEEGTQEDIEENSSDTMFLEHFLNSIDIYDPEELEDQPQKKQVMISTIHSAKGLEWPVVFVAGLSQGKFPSLKVDTSIGNFDQKMCEERRVLYVAMTRAKQLLYVSSASEPSKLVSRLAKWEKMSSKQTVLASRHGLQSLGVDNGIEELIKRYQLLHQNYQASEPPAIRKHSLPSMENRVKYAGGPQVPQGFKLSPLTMTRPNLIKNLTNGPFQIAAMPPPIKGPADAANQNGKIEPPKKRKTLGIRRRRV
jgi:DNA helicase-2/ATP-dependent DNA helicase PcrA